MTATLSETTTAPPRELGRWACRWARGLVLINGHGSNAPTVVSAVTTLRNEGRPIAWTGWGIPGTDAHAGRTKTSLLRNRAPWTVRVDLAEAGATEPIDELTSRLRGVGVRIVSPNGILGDARRSSAEEGRRDLAVVVDRQLRELSEQDVCGDGSLRTSKRIGVGS